MCVGCRQRATKRELLRVTLGEVAGGGDGETVVPAVVPDPDGTAPGRGAHLHPVAACLALGERKAAFPRALRYRGGSTLSLDAVRQHVLAHATE